MAGTPACQHYHYGKDYVTAPEPSVLAFRPHDDCPTRTREHRFQPLAANEIRLVAVAAPVGGDNCMRLTTSFHLLEEAPPFTVLSYARGPDVRDRTIVLDGKHFPVGEGVFQALGWTRRKPDTDFYWIDALCIDSSNVTEKNRQVALTMEILSRAASVVAHLGQPCIFPGMERAMVKEMQELTRLVHDAEYVEAKAKEGVRVPPLLYPIPIEFTLSVRYVLELLTSDWMRRSWPVVESVVNDQTWAWWGNASFELKLVLDVANGYFGYSSPEKLDILSAFSAPQRDLFVPAVHRMRSIRSFRAHQATHGKQQQHLVDLMRHCRAQEASDARDKVFALVGLSRSIYREALPTQYGPELCSLELFRVAARVMVRQTPFTYLREVEMSSDDRTALPAGFPSWIVDWSHSFTRPLLLSDHTAMPRVVGTPKLPEKVLLDEHDRLTISGITIAKIKALAPRPDDVVSGGDVGRRSSSSRGRASVLARVDAIESFWAEKATTPARYPTGQPLRLVTACVMSCSAKQPRGGNRPAAVASLENMQQEEEVAAAAAEEATACGSHFRTVAERILSRMRLGLTDGDLLGQFPLAALDGDVLVAFNGSDIPFLLRPVGATTTTNTTAAAVAAAAAAATGVGAGTVAGAGPRTKCYRMVGHAYVHGLLGSPFTLDPRSFLSTKQEDFVII